MLEELSFGSRLKNECKIGYFKKGVANNLNLNLCEIGMNC